ncbi:hypothetical protein AAE478_004073 [Parahypoxylon ruwenzoriense]
MENWRRPSGGKPFCIEGIQSVTDAHTAVDMGVDGIVVSNHAGRQVDGAVASLYALERIVDALGDKTFRYQIMHWHWGAKFVWVGCLRVYDLGAGGKEGARHVMKGLLADFDILRNVPGYPHIKDINRDATDSLPSVAYLPYTAELA